MIERSEEQDRRPSVAWSPRCALTRPLPWTSCLLLLAACHAGIQVNPTETGTRPDSSDSSDSSDSHDPVDTSVEKVPGGLVPVPTFSSERGFYDDPFDLVLSSETEGARIGWTLDGSEPSRSPTATWSDAPVTLRIDPDDETGRFTAPGVVVRAVAESPEGAMSASITHTYLFLDRIADLSPDDRPPGSGWPDIYDTNNYVDIRQSIHYGLDPRVTGDPDYAGLIESAFTAIPTFSIVTDLENLFDPSTGIYENAMEHGIDWERAASIELIDPSGSPDSGFQANAGLRIRGGWSRHSDDPKHAFRLFFRETWGPPRLEFPLFGDEGVPSFDTFDLRTSQNYSWSYKGDEGRENVMNRDVFSRDTQRDLGRPYTRSRFYHLYLDGVYWGIFQTQERSEADYAVSYFGGEEADWDVVKVDGDDPEARDIEATDGNLDSWRTIWTLSQEGFADNRNWYTLRGLDENGVRDPALPVLVDVDNLIDYMLVIFYAGNFDSPTGSFTGNKEPNNFFLIDNREDPNDGFRFFVHDAEHTLLADAWSPGVGRTEDRVNIGTRTDYYQMQVTTFEHFHPQWLHEKLKENAEYRSLFSARVGELFFGDGVFTNEACRARFEARAAEIQVAIIAESARWGDSKDFNEGGRTWRTRDDDWIPAVARVVDEFMTGPAGESSRTDIVIAQLREAGLYAP